MRDDLHRTVPLPHSWRSVLKGVCRERRTPEELASLLTRAVSKDMGGAGIEAIPRIRAAVQTTETGLFAGDAGALHSQLQGVLEGELLPLERRGVERALALLDHREVVPKAFLDEAACYVLREHAADMVEHVISRVAAVHGARVANEVAAKLMPALLLTDFSRPLPRTRKTTEEFLATPIEIVVD